MSNTTRTEYRVIWKREGLNPKRKKYLVRAAAERFMLILGPEPWRAFADGDPDEYFCCSGRECGCGGTTIREDCERRREGLPAIEYVRLESRTVTCGDWTQTTKAKA